MTRKERGALFRAAAELGDVPYCALRLTWECANRVTETLHARLEDIDRENRVMQVKRLKGSRTVHVDLSNVLLRLIDRTTKGRTRGYVFPGRGRCDGSQSCMTSPVRGHLSRRTLSNWMERAGKEAGLHPGLCRMHTLKHTSGCDRARELAKEGLDAHSLLKTLMDFTGHESVDAVMIYLRDPEDIEKTHQRVRRMLEEA